MLTLPAPRVPDPATAPPLRWGIVAPGWIASNFARALRTHTAQRLVAVASRSPQRAADFAREYEIPRVHASYQDLYDDDGVDAIYVASPHSEHHAQALGAIAAGKHVLVEKAFTRNAAEARDVVAAGREAGVLVMEAMWSRYLPHTDVVRQLLEDGALGEVRYVTADFGSAFDATPDHRLLDPALAGGVLLDLGVYPIAFASFVLRTAGVGWPPEMSVVGELAGTGVDAQVALQLTRGPVDAHLFATMHAVSAREAAVHGRNGSVRTGEGFFEPTSVTWRRGEDEATWDANTITGLDGLCFQAAALARYVAEGRVESVLQPLAETVEILELVDRARALLGVRYPGE